MFKPQKDQLFSLIKSLNKSEKRNFRLYVNRIQSGNDTKFTLLFDVLDRLPAYDEKQVLKKLPGVKKRHLGNLKRHLYKQILVSLRLVHIKKNIDIQIREQLDFARILYGKGMYMESLKVLERIKRIALEHHQDILHLEILEFEKLIEARHITRTRLIKGKMESLLAESSRRSQVIHSTSRLSNFSIEIHGYYITKGHIRSEDEIGQVRDFFTSNLSRDLISAELTFFEKIHLYQSYMWYHYIILDFDKCCDYSRQWVNLFQANPQMMEKDPDLYMRGLYYLLTFLFFARAKEDFYYYLGQFELFEEANKEVWNANSRQIAFIYLNLSKLNYCFLNDHYQAGLVLADDILEQLSRHVAQTDIHRILLFYYKIAYLYFATGNFEKALEFLNEIINLQGAPLREDLHLYARLLHLLCHFELKNIDLIQYLIPSLQRALNKSTENTLLAKATLRFVHKLLKIPGAESKRLFIAFQKETDQLKENPFEKKAFLFLDIPSWIESHLIHFQA